MKDCTELKTLGHSKIWLEITKYIPSRTVDSVYKMIRRSLDSKNKQGYWNKEEEAELHLNAYNNMVGNGEKLVNILIEHLTI